MFPRHAIRELTFADLDFDKRRLGCFSSAGTYYTRWLPVGMPRIPEEYLSGVFYLYASRSDAEKGEDCGGSGFFIGMASAAFPETRSHVYAVTNWHVAVRDGASVIRVNRLDGSCDIFEYGPEEWNFDPRYDIAVLEIDALKRSVHESTVLHLSACFTKPLIKQAEIGVGDDVFMIGRFMDHDGGPTNRPAARFGNISVMPSPIEQPNGKHADSYCVDMHARTGYSGSPVFIYRTIGGDLRSTDKSLKSFSPNVNFLGLLGILWGHFPEEWEISDAQKVNSGYITGMSGMSCVLPAWTILEVINMDKIREARRKDDEETMRREGPERKASPRAMSKANAAKSAPSTTADNPSHKEDFTRLVSAAARKKPPAD